MMPEHDNPDYIEILRSSPDPWKRTLADWCDQQENPPEVGLGEPSEELPFLGHIILNLPTKEAGELRSIQLYELAGRMLQGKAVLQVGNENIVEGGFLFASLDDTQDVVRYLDLLKETAKNLSI